MNPLETSTFTCPYCCQINSIEVDLSCDFESLMVQDCQVCCNPVLINLTLNDAYIQIEANKENE